MDSGTDFEWMSEGGKAQAIASALHLKTQKSHANTCFYYNWLALCSAFSHVWQHAKHWNWHLLSVLLIPFSLSGPKCQPTYYHCHPKSNAASKRYNRKKIFKKNVHAGAFIKTENRGKWIKIGQFHTEDTSESKEHIITATNEMFWLYSSYLGPDQSTHSSCQVREEGLLMKNLAAFTPTAFLSTFFSVSPVHNLCFICLSLLLWFSVCHLHWGDNGRLFKKLVSMSLGVT